MPTYSYRCPSCQAFRYIVKSLAKLNQPECCFNACEGMMERQISAPAIRGDYAGYNCPVTGKWIEGRRAHEENLKEQGCRVFEPGERNANEQHRRHDDAQLDKQVEQTAGEFVAKLDGDARDQLGKALEQGADVAVTRL